MTDPAAAVPLTPSQQRLWVLAELRPEDPFYSIPFTVDLDGPLDTRALRRSLDELVHRHTPLRTSIRGSADELTQTVHEPESVPLETTDLSELPPAEAEERAAALAADLARQPFDLADGPLLRLLLVSLPGARHKLVVNVHHIVFDGPSLDIFVGELMALYEGFSTGEPAALPELPLTYGEFLSQRRAAQDPGRADESRRYWTQRLRGAPEAMELPLKGARTVLSDHRSARVSRHVPLETVEPLRQLARTRRATPFMVLKSACDVLLRQHGVTDVLMGTPLSGRDSVQAGGLIGYFTQPVVLRTEFTGDPAFTEVLTQVRNDVLDAHEHGELPFEEVLRDLGVVHDPSYTPFYQVMFGHLEQQPEGKAAGCSYSAANLRLETTPVELEFTLMDAEDGLWLHLDYRVDLFEEATAVQLVERYRTILERVAAAPEARMSELTAATDAERQQVTTGWNSTGAPYRHRAGIHQLVEEQAERTPDAQAAQSGDRRWTYRELEAAANQVAHFLRGLGVGPQTHVGLCVPRSLELLAVMLGIFKAGGVYVPLDPSLPSQRLETLLADAGPRYILAAPEYLHLFAAHAERLVPMETQDRWAAAGEPTHRVEPMGSSAEAAYILYTSGSTGGPKGVVLEHRNLNNLLNWAHSELGSDTFSVVPLISSLSFDVSMWEIFTTLTCGGRVVIADDAFSLARTPGAEETTLLTAVPSILSELLKRGEIPASARTVISNGEVLPPTVLAGLYDTGTVDVVYNMYAPTETTTFSLFNIVRPGEPIPIGRPMDNTQAYVLDPWLRPVPPGVVGQLHLGGAGVTRGYLGRPGLTAERFIPDPFSDEPGRRLYATGDMVRHAPDGRLLFTGRADHQVKLRGCRIELGEVEAALLSHPDITEACAMVTRGAQGDSLAAAAVSRDPEALTADGVRSYLQERLPGYMVPDRLRIAASLPLLNSGKLDRKRILEELSQTPHVTGDDAPAGGEPWASASERHVAEAWQEVLGGPVGVHQNFFDAGGNSLAMVLVRERLRTVFGRDLNIVDIFRNPTVRALAAFLDGTGQQPAPSGPHGGQRPPTAADGGTGRGQARQQARRNRARHKS